MKERFATRSAGTTLRPRTERLFIDNESIADVALEHPQIAVVDALPQAAAATAAEYRKQDGRLDQSFHCQSVLSPALPDVIM
jgi:hypothetical protein